MARGGARPGAGRKRSYEAYVRQYKRAEKQLKANGVEMNQRMLKKNEFEAQYTRLLNTRKQEVSSGKRKTTGNITRDIIERQKFGITKRQYEALVRGIKDKTKLKGYNFYELRAGYFIENEETDYYAEYMASHPNGSHEEALQYARREINTELFGS